MMPVNRFGNFYSNDTFKQALGGLLLGVDSGHLWFLTALFWCILVFVVVLKIFDYFHINSIYGILSVAGIIQLTYSSIPFDVLGFKMGLSYIFYFSLGYVFEIERSSSIQWNMYKTILAYAVMFVIEILHSRYGILNTFFAIIVGSFMTYILADICSRYLDKFTGTRVWRFLIRKIFYVYLFYDPLEYIVLRLFIECGFLTTGIGCVLYAFTRTVFIFIISLWMGELVGLVKRIFNSLLNKDIEYGVI